MEEGTGEEKDCSPVAEEPESLSEDSYLRVITLVKAVIINPWEGQHGVHHVAGVGVAVAAEEE